MANLTGYVLAYNGVENIACYKAGADSASGLDVDIIPPYPTGRLLSIDWATPGSTNGVSVTCFDYVKATSTTKPRADAQKVITVQDTSNGGSYRRYLVPDAYVAADYAAGTAIGAVTIPAPILFFADTVIAPSTPGAVTYQGSIYVPILTLTTYTATAYGYLADGVTPIVFAPATSTGTSVALLAAAMQTNWASEIGSGTFTATGQIITYNTTNGASIAFVITQA